MHLNHITLRARTVLLLVGLACASAPPKASVGDGVPREAGTLASAETCRITGAWAPSGQAATPPVVARCVLPRYPESMRAANQQGEIVWRVAVDSLGVTDPSSVTIVRSSAPALTVAVRRAVSYLRFAPEPGRPRLIVELPTTFTLERTP